MKTVMALLEKGEREREAQEPELPADLGQLLAMVDGQRSQEELIRLNGGSATVAGGLRWLQVAGYVENRVVDEGWQDSAWITQPSSLTVRDVFTGLRNHLRAQLQQHGGAAAATYLAQVDAAQDVEQLIALVAPLLEVVAEHGGDLAAASMAETVALLLSPLGGRSPV